MAQLALVAATIVGEFMDEDNRRTRTRFLVMKPDAIVGREVRHRCPSFGAQRSILRRVARLRQAGRLARSLNRSLAGPGPRRIDEGRSGPGSPDHIRTSFPDQLSPICTADAQLPIGCTTRHTGRQTG
jgi:hypothetical protein